MEKVFYALYVDAFRLSQAFISKKTYMFDNTA